MAYGPKVNSCAGLMLSALTLLSAGCGKSTDASEIKVVDVPHTPVERQAIGNCWIYAYATWLESMHLAATGEEFDTSQSYLTYMHWFRQIANGSAGSKIDTSGSWQTAAGLARNFGLIAETDFLPADSLAEMSWHQGEAERRINFELSSGRLSTLASRTDRALIKTVLDEVFALSPEVAGKLSEVFGPSLQRRFSGTAEASDLASDPTGTIKDPANFVVRYSRQQLDGSKEFVTSDLLRAASEWRSSYYPEDGLGRRRALARVQRALHDRQPVLINWAVDFNALDNTETEWGGSFSLKTLRDASGPGSQGFHVSVLEDYEVRTVEYGLLAAGVTLDPESHDDRSRLKAALADSSRIVKLRTKNSWGASRPDRVFVKDFPGYNDLMMNYLNGPITWCDESANNGTPSERGCDNTVVPLSTFILPPGY